MFPLVLILAVAVAALVATVTFPQKKIENGELDLKMPEDNVIEPAKL